MQIGDRVEFIGCAKGQTQWGNNDDPMGKLVIGSEYLVENIEIHTMHTKITIRGINGRFNSVCFRVI